MSVHLREGWRKLAIQVNPPGEIIRYDREIPVVHVNSDYPGMEGTFWHRQQDGTPGHELVLIEYWDNPNSFLPACICGVSWIWGAKAGRYKAAEKFWQKHTQTEPWRLRQAIRATRGGVLEMVPTQTVIRTYKFMDAMSGSWEDIRAENLADAKSGSAQFSSWGLDPGEPSLYESIRDEGFWEAILVFEYDNGERWVVDGHTRLSVAEDLGLPQVPIEVRHEKSTQPVKVVVEGKTAASEPITLTYERGGEVRHACNWGATQGELVESGPTLDIGEARRNRFDSQAYNAMRPCCARSYQKMKS